MYISIIMPTPPFWKPLHHLFIFRQAIAKLRGIPLCTIDSSLSLWLICLLIIELTSELLSDSDRRAREGDRLGVFDRVLYCGGKRQRGWLRRNDDDSFPSSAFCAGSTIGRCRCCLAMTGSAGRGFVGCAEAGGSSCLLTHDTHIPTESSSSDRVGGAPTG